MTRILLIGKAGQVGHELQQMLMPLGRVVGVARDELDLTQVEQIRQVIQTAQPDLIVNAAAYTAVDKAESEVELAQAINGTAPTVMAEEARSLKIPLIHISTDYVFDGSQSTPYREIDPTNPIGVYGQSKLAGEIGIQQVCEESATPYAILRTAWVYGTYGKGNFVKTMLRLGKEREEVRVVADQIGSPTWAADIARTIAVLSRGLLAEANGQTPLSLSGIYHFANSGAASWYDFAVAIFEEAQALKLPLRLRQVVPITTAEYPTPAQRPAYSVLACQKVGKLLPAPPTQWRQALRQMLTEYIHAHESNYSVRR
ncbi:dTDP-4-dehydrorhamnose reductase [Leptolyngbya ohadii]|uniref:dTDP-4-dehydrorhamnose reductase n=1 Tax=Leptolyngbya ohadii TaxID=1962290 RepID=UPI000B59DE24|nr:dTDP-4-dehydrorhamnose reductase [Leptolyngbya ohadii]